jgi:hypothetical protein
MRNFVSSTLGDPERSGIIANTARQIFGSVLPQAGKKALSVLFTQNTN